MSAPSTCLCTMRAALGREGLILSGLGRIGYWVEGLRVQGVGFRVKDFGGMLRNGKQGTQQHTKRSISQRSACNFT